VGADRPANRHPLLKKMGVEGVENVADAVRPGSVGSFRSPHHVHDQVPLVSRHPRHHDAGRDRAGSQDRQPFRWHHQDPQPPQVCGGGCPRGGRLPVARQHLAGAGRHPGHCNGRSGAVHGPPGQLGNLHGSPGRQQAPHRGTHAVHRPQQGQADGVSARVGHPQCAVRVSADGRYGG